MIQARLNARWHGHALGATVSGRDAEAAIAAGRAEQIDPPKRRRITTGAGAKQKAKSSPTREPNPEETDDNDTAPSGGT